MSISPPQENKMGTLPVNKLLLSMSVPMMFSMLIQALYNVVDSMFVSYISEGALTAVSLAFPMQNLMIAVATGTCVGVNALLSRNLGEKRFDMANQTANNAIFINILSYGAFALIGLGFAHLYFTVQVDNPVLIDYGTQYLRIVMIFSFGHFGQVMFSRLLQSTGRTFYSMIGQVVAACVGLRLNLRKNPEITLSLREIRPNKAVISRIYSVGVPSIILQSVISILTFGLNQVLVSFTEVATAVYGVYFKLQGFAFLPIIGMNNAVVPIIAYNYGARKRERIVQTIKLSIIYAVIVMAVALFIFQMFPDKLLSIFQASDEMLAVGVPALRTMSLCFSIGGFTIVCSSVFQALGKGLLSMIISVIRQLALVLPLANLFALSGNLDLVWWAFPVAEVIGGALAIWFLIGAYRNVIQPLGNDLPVEAC